MDILDMFDQEPQQAGSLEELQVLKEFDVLPGQSNRIYESLMDESYDEEYDEDGEEDYDEEYDDEECDEEYEEDDDQLIESSSHLIKRIVDAKLDCIKMCKDAVESLTEDHPEIAESLLKVVEKDLQFTGNLIKIFNESVQKEMEEF